MECALGEPLTSVAMPAWGSKQTFKARCLVRVSSKGNSTPKALSCIFRSFTKTIASIATNAGIERSKGVVPVSTSAENTSPGRPPKKKGILHKRMVLPVLEPSAKWKSLVRSVISHW